MLSDNRMSGRVVEVDELLDDELLELLEELLLELLELDMLLDNVEVVLVEVVIG